MLIIIISSTRSGGIQLTRILDVLDGFRVQKMEPPIYLRTAYIYHEVCTI